MDREELTKRLLEDELDSQPGPWKDLRPERAPMPGELRGALRKQIAAARTSADAGEVKKFPAARGLMAAAAVLLIAVGAAVYLLRDGGPQGTIVIKTVRGMGHRLLDGKQTALVAGDILKAGGAFSLEQNASVSMFLGTGRKNLAYFRGPGRFVFLKRVPKSGEVHFRVLEGAAVIGSAGGKERIVWQADSTLYRMAGTLARLAVGDGTRKLEVLLGSFQVQRSAGVITVSAGKALEGTDTAARPMTSEEIKALGSLKNRLESIRAGRPMLDASVTLNTIEKIRDHYGIIHETLLKDGRRYSGYAVKERVFVRVHTAFGVVNLRRADVAEIRPLDRESE